MKWKTLKDSKPNDEEKVLIVVDGRVRAGICFYEWGRIENSADFFYMGFYFELVGNDYRPIALMNEVSHWANWPKPPE